MPEFLGKMGREKVRAVLAVDMTAALMWSMWLRTDTIEQLRPLRPFARGLPGKYGFPYDRQTSFSN